MAGQLFALSRIGGLMREQQIKLFGRWLKVPEFIYNWCNANLCRAKKWGVSRIKVDIPDEPKASDGR